jgi:hypothetical protein
MAMGRVVKTQIDSCCKLCGVEAELRNSHVIPEWLYRPLYDEIHRYHVINAVPLTDRRFGQKGLRERLLCQTCETKFSIYEGYARGVLFGGEEITFVKRGDGIELRDLDYMKLKLFQLSLLWRAGVARQDFFSNVNLDCDEEPLRKMLLAGDPGKSSEYGCAMIPLVTGSNALVDLILQPVPVKSGEFDGYRFVFGGHTWIYILGDGRSFPFSKLCLQEDGRLFIRRADARVMSFIKRLASTFGDAAVSTT